MGKFLFGILVVTSTFGFVAWSAAQDSRQVNSGAAFTESNREKASERGGDYQNVPDAPRSAAATVIAVDLTNSPKETILGMDPTIALFVVFGVFLVLVVAIVASSRGNRSHE